jgi:hypothetical protein
MVELNVILLHEGAALDAGRVMLTRLKELNPTLASRTFAPWIRELKKTGYRFHLSAATPCP